MTCTKDEFKQISAGKGVVINGVWYEKAKDYSPPKSSVVAGVPGSYPTTSSVSISQNAKVTTSSTIALTGVYTATGRPTPTSGAASLRLRRRETRSKTQKPVVVHGSQHLLWLIPVVVAGGLFLT